MRITVVHQGALGDTVLLVPLVRSLRKRFGEGARVTMVTRPALGQMLMMLGHVDQWASADDLVHTKWFAPPLPSGPANAMPPWADCDLLLSAVSSGADAWAENARRAAKHGRVLFLEPRPPADYAGHVAAWHREQLAELGLQEPDPPLLKENPDGPIVVHPGSGGEAKCWPREKFLELGRTLKRNGILPTFILGEAEHERWGNKLVESLQEDFPWYLHMGLFELAEKLGRARLYVGNDSGVTQLAAMVGVPTIALFGPSDDQQWRPLGASVKVLRAAPPRERELEALELEAVLGEMLAELRRL